MHREYPYIKIFSLYGIVLSLFIAATLLPSFVAAAENQFTIGLTVTADVTPPTVPTGLSPSVISSSQINLSWTASTDDVAVAGYVVRRDGVAISTTTAITYADTGRAASTQYSYTVEAFDASGNYSGQTGVVYATTSAPSSGGGGDTTPPTVLSLSPANGASGVASTSPLSMTFSELVSVVSGNIVLKRVSDGVVIETIAVGSSQVVLVGTVVTITPTTPFESNTAYYVEVDAGTFKDQASNNFSGISGNSMWTFATVDSVGPIIAGVLASTTYTTALLTFDTNENSIATVQWGTSTAYSTGSASEIIYSSSHSMGFPGLATNTLYYFRISAVDGVGNSGSPYTGTFLTKNPPPPPDTTPPANPSDLSASPSLTSVALSWVNPSDVDFQAVRVMRRTNGYPVDQNDGVLVYDGGSSSVIDTGLATGTTYYYSIFARDTLLNYSSGAIISATTDTEIVTPPPPPTPTPTPTPPPPTPGGTDPIPTPGTTPIIPPITGTTSGPFVDFPATGTPSASILLITLDDFIFTQLGDVEQLLQIKKGVVRTNGKKNVRISIPYNKLPEVLKTIAITIIDPNKNNKESSYLLSVNSTKTTFEGVIPVFLIDDTYPFVINILDHEEKGIARIPGTFDVYFPIQLPTIVPPAITKAINDVVENIQAPVDAVSPIAVPIGVAVGASQAVLLATNVGSVYDIYLLMLKFIGLLTGLFRRKRHEPWGVVYDSVTKRPLDPAYVIAQVRNTQKSKGEAITDLDGRYGFLLNPGEYVIVANKTHYKFPSDKLKGRSRDEFYENLYFGDSFQVREGSAVTYNIPLDPIEFDWNEYAKNQDKVFQVYSRNTNIRLWIFNIIFYLGFTFSALTLFVSPSKLNLFVVLVYVGIVTFQIFWKVTHKVTRVLNANTGKPYPFALIKVWLPGMDTVVKKTVTDETGRFYFLIPPGTYYITIEEKLPDGTYHEVLRTKEMQLAKGVVKNDFHV